MMRWAAAAASGGGGGGGASGAYRSADEQGRCWGGSARWGQPSACVCVAESGRRARCHAICTGAATALTRVHVRAVAIDSSRCVAWPCSHTGLLLREW